MFRKVTGFIMLGFCLIVLSGCGLFVRHLPSGELPVPTPQAQDHFIKIKDVTYHYTEYPADGADVLMVHGFGSSTYTWEKVAPTLQKSGYHVWAVDMKGFGWSDKPRNGKYDAYSLMEEVNTWMEAVGLKQVVFVGNSLGGAVAVLMDLKHPDKIERMVLVDAGGYPQQKPLVIRLGGLPGAVGAFKLFFGRWMVSWNLKEVFFHGKWVTPEAIDAYYDRMRTKGGLDAQAAVIKALDFDAFAADIKRIPEIKTPTLILWGQDDYWIPLANGKLFRRDLKNSVLAIVPECGHVMQEEYPDLTARLILEFLSGTLKADVTLPVQPHEAR